LESKPSDLALESKPSDLALESKPSDLDYLALSWTGFAIPFAMFSNFKRLKKTC